MSTYQLGIDGSAAEAGAKRIVKSFDDIKAAAARMEGGATKSFSTMARAYSELSKLGGVRADTLKTFREFSQAVGSFKGPSQANLNNTKKFFDYMKSISGFKAPSATGLKGLLNSLSGYKGPTQASAKNTAALLRALNGFSAPKAPAGFTNFLAALGSFKGPGANAGKNTRALMTALASFKPPPNMNGTIKKFQELATAIDKAAASMSHLRSGSRGSLGTPNMGRAAGDVRNLAQHYGALETAIFRTQTAINALGGVLGLKTVVDAGIKITQIRNQLNAATGSAAQGAVQFAFLRTETERLGLEFTTTAKSYGMLLGSIKGTNVTFAEAQKIFLGFSTAARALHLSTDDVDGVFRALGQIMSKGKLQAEELRGQLGDRLPGAFVRFAKALDMTKPGQLDDALKKGAISGDKLKNAILEVASTLENEFAGNAADASKTVEAAFNRLTNTFNFMASDLGQNGLNSFLISLTDSLRKLMESAVLNSALEALGGLLKMVGDNIEIVASAITGLAIVGFTKWALATQTATKALAALNLALNVLKAAQFGSTAMAMAAGMGSIATATTGVGRAMLILRGIMATMGWPLLIAAIGAVVYAFSQMESKSQEAKKALENAHSSIADGANLLDAYIAKNLDISKVLNQQTEDLNRNTLSVLENTRAKAGDAQLGRVQSVTSFAGTDFVGFGGDKKLFIDGKRVDPALSNLIRPLTRVGAGTGINGATGGQSNRLRVPTNAKEFQAFVKNAAALKANVQLGGKFAAGQETVDAAEAVIGSMIRESGVKGNRLGFDAAKIAGVLGGDYNQATQPPGISGDAPVKAAKAGKGANQYRNAIQGAIDALSDLDVKAKATQTLIDAVSNGAQNSIAASARANAASKVEDFEQAFRGENIAKRQQGIIDIAKAMNLQAGSYDQAKSSLISYYAAADEKQQRLDNDRKVQDSIISLKEENDVRKNYVQSIADGGKALAEANIAMEVEKQLLNGSVENHDKLAEALRSQLKDQLALNRAEEMAKAINDAQVGANVASSTANLYGQGLNSRDLQNAKDLISYQEELKNSALGYSNAQINFLVGLRQQSQATQTALDKLEERYQAAAQLAGDIAGSIGDTFADIFKNGYDEGENFLKKMKNLLKSLKDMLLDFVLFNPLKQFLTDSLTGTISSSTTSSGLKNSVFKGAGSVTDSAIAGGGMITSLLATIGRQASGASPATGTSASDASRALLYAGDQIGAAASDTITVTANRLTDSTMSVQQGTNDYFGQLKKVFDYRANGSALSDGLGQIKGVFTTGGSFSKKLDSFGKGLGQVGKAAGAALAAYGTGSGVAKMLGLGKGGQKIAGMASAGFSLGGPIGAGIGAVLGGAMAIFGKKTPSSFGNISVGESGAVSVTGGKYGKGSAETGLALGNAGASVFSDFANNFGGSLSAGSYGAFGQRKIKNDGVKGESYFYSSAGIGSKGKPAGVKGVDWISSADQSVVQAFALVKQITDGAITGLNDVYKQVAKATPSGSNMDTLNNNLAVGKSYLDFIDSAKIMTDTQKQVMQLADNFKSLRGQSKALGLDTQRLDKAYAKLMLTYKQSFDNDISQQILEITDPVKAAYNDLVTDYKTSVADAMAVGGDLTEVERLYGLKRVELAKQYADEANNGVAAAAKDLLTQLTASQSSPLSATDTLRNAKSEYDTLRNEILGGDYTNADKLQQYASNYLDAARSTGKSSYDYFSVYGDVTDFLKQVTDLNSVTNPADLDALPGLQTIIDEINSRNNDLLTTTQGVGTAILEGNSTAKTQADITNALLEAILEVSQNGVVSQSTVAVLKSVTKTPSL